MERPWYWPKGGQPHRAEPFTWIVKGKMAGSWWPDEKLIEIYKKVGIKVIINCSEFDNRKDIPREFVFYRIDIPDYGLPTEAQVKEFLDITDAHGAKGEAIVVHCVAGCGRTGQMIIGWAAHNGVLKKGEDPVVWIRNLRKCCLETEEQVQYARKLVKIFLKTNE